MPGRLVASGARAHGRRAGRPRGQVRHSRLRPTAADRARAPPARSPRCQKRGTTPHEPVSPARARSQQPVAANSLRPRRRDQRSEAFEKLVAFHQGVGGAAAPAVSSGDTPGVHRAEPGADPSRWAAGRRSGTVARVAGGRARAPRRRRAGSSRPPARSASEVCRPHPPRWARPGRPAAAGAVPLADPSRCATGSVLPSEWRSADRLPPPPVPSRRTAYRARLAATHADRWPP